MLTLSYIPRLLNSTQPENEHNAIHGYFLKFRSQFEENNIDLLFNNFDNQCDIAWIGDKVWSNSERFTQVPIIQELVNDDSWISTRLRNVLLNKQVIGVTRGSVLRNLENYKKDSSEPRYHSTLVKQNNHDCDWPETKKLSQLELEKMIPSPSFAHILRHEPIYKWAREHSEEATGSGKRDYDCHFAGTLMFKDEQITYHRRLAHTKISRLQKAMIVGNEVKTASARLTKEDYLKTLRNSKSCLSPWGYGECCHRDYEAILSGCVLIKPDTTHVVMYPDLFAQHADTYVPCRIDFADLPEIVEDISSNWDKYQSIRENAYNLLMDAIKPEVAIRDLCTEIKIRHSNYLARNVSAA